MADSRGPEHKGGEVFSSDAGELGSIEHGVDVLGTAAAGAGALPAAPPPADLPPGGNVPQPDATHPAFHFASDAGDLRSIEEGVKQTEKGEEAVRGEVF